jgi:hypothetical protein
MSRLVAWYIATNVPEHLLTLPSNPEDGDNIIVKRCFLFARLERAMFQEVTILR